MGGHRTRTGSRGGDDKTQLASIRSWAKENRYEDSVRGRNPAGVQEA
ncbi:MAG: Lsr2 family protein [Actinomycetales bacterium]|nr:Lsr2 family protein [Candidatus Lutibacillus vidarii]